MGWKQVPLNQKGKEQARKLAERLKDEFPFIRHVFSSDLLRARQTTEIIMTALSDSIPVTYLEHLRERKWGDFEGHSIQDLRQHGKNIHSLEPPGAETRQEFYHRCQQALEAMESFFAWDEEDVILIVTHGGTIRQILGSLFKLGPEQKRRMPATINNCSITIVKKQLKMESNPQSPEYLYILEKLNDTCHLIK